MSDPFETEERQLEEDGLEALAAVAATPPPPGLRERLLVTIDGERAAARARRWRATAFVAAAAAALLAVAFVTERVGWSAAAEADLRALEDAFAVHSEVIRILTAPRLVSASLLPPPGGGGGVARVLMDPASGAVAVVGAGLPPPRAGRVYRLWAIRGERPPEPAGVLTASGERSFVVRLRHVDAPVEVTEFAISMEPTPSTTRPTGPIVLAGVVDP